MKLILRNLFTWIALLLSLTVQAKNSPFFSSTDYVKALKKVTDIMVNDVTSPVSASRYYAYLTISANEVLAGLSKDGANSFLTQLNGFKQIDVTQLPNNENNKEFSTILMVFKMGEKLLPSGYLLKKQIDSLLVVAAKKGISKITINNSVAYVDAVVQKMLPYIKSDGFASLSNLRRYTPVNGDAYWQPTQPAFMAPVEPHWNSLKTFILDSAQQFKPLPPAVYDTNTTSVYFRQLKEVYDISKRANAEKNAIAMFWDCNPFAVQQMGHVQYGLKKISPGGHWIGITGIACIIKKYSLQKTVQVHALVSVVLADAFLACWDEKYRSNRVRPETAINKLIDHRWHPLLQTPPFPEYVSGHSVASTAAASVLTKIFGENFSFNDNTEVEFELPVRKFKSFNAAAAEAAISRLYGGIHYRDAIDEGVWQGRKVGEYSLMKLNNYLKMISTQ